MASAPGPAALPAEAPPPAGAAAPPPPAASSVGILDLPSATELAIFSQLSAADLAACLATCSAWRAAAAAPELWAGLARRRWRHGWERPGGELAALMGEGRWLEAYRWRRQADAAALELLGAVPWPERQRGAMQALRQRPFRQLSDLLRTLRTLAEVQRQTPAGGGGGGGSETVDAAAAALGADWPDAAAAAAAAPCSVAHWARDVYEDLNVREWAGHVRRLGALADAAEFEVARRAAAAIPRGAAPGPSGAGAATAAGESQGRLQGEARWLEAALHDPAAAVAGLSIGEATALPDWLLAEGALALAHVHHPLADLGWVRSALDALGCELRRRMEAQGAAPDSLEALRLLSHLLFGEGPPPRMPQFAAIPPPDGYGLGIQGNRERYYQAENSLLDCVLSQREGIPISLAVLHAAVGVRAGLRLQLLNVPMHVLTSMHVTHVTTGAAEGAPGAVGNEAACYYVDVFDGGRIMDRHEFGAFLQGLGIPLGDPVDAPPLLPRPAWGRMCRNLLPIHRERGSHSLLKATALLMAAAVGEETAEGVRAAMEAVNACLAQQQFEEAAELLAALVHGPPQQQLGHAAALHEPMLSEIQGAAEAHVQKQMEVHRRSGPGGAGVRFRVGQLIRHQRYQYRGVIVGWDATCRASEEWMQQMGVDQLPGGRHQPFYNVLPDPEGRPGQAQTYVAQENITLEPLPPLHACKPGYALHPDAGRYFDALQPDGAAYRPCAWLARAYPEG